MTLLLRLILALLACCAALPAHADELRPGYLELTQKDTQHWRMVWKAPVLGGLAGILVAPILFVSIQMGATIALKAFAATIIGGFGDVTGAIIGGIALGSLGDRIGRTRAMGVCILFYSIFAALGAFIVARTRWPVSEAESAIFTVSTSRSSPTTMTSGSSRRDPFKAD